MVSLSAFLQIIADTAHIDISGGIIGISLSNIFIGLLSGTGAYIISIALVIVSLILASPVSIFLIFLILSQAKGGGLSAVFGGESGVYRTKRGFEKTLHYLTIIFSIIFFSTALIIVLLT